MMLVQIEGLQPRAQREAERVGDWRAAQPGAAWGDRNQVALAVGRVHMGGAGAPRTRRYRGARFGAHRTRVARPQLHRGALWIDERPAERRVAVGQQLV